MTDEGPRIYGRAGDVELTVEGSEDDDVEDIEKTFDEKFEMVSEKKRELVEKGPSGEYDR